MLEEVGTIIKIESEALWVETVQRSACGSCSAQKGCGQHTLGKVLGTCTSIRVLLQGQTANQFQLNQQVRIGIPEDVVVKGALIVYLLPLLLMILLATIGYSLTSSDGASALAALLGLLIGGSFVRRRARESRDDPRLQPVLLDTLGTYTHSGP